MVQVAVVDTGALDAGWILAPERYDPRRSQAAFAGVALSTIARVVNDTVAPGDPDSRLFLVLDTSDAAGGFIRQEHAPRPRNLLGSSKKLAQSGDVVISRLRPYLRQVGFVDAELAKVDGSDCVVALSTEFIVLRSASPGSIAFLVPFLLGADAQEILAASQEGGHHPRISPSSVSGLRLPDRVVEDRMAVSEQVEAAVAMAREAQLVLRRLSGRTLAATAVERPVAPGVQAGRRDDREDLGL